MKYGWSICRFDSTLDIPKSKRTYQAIKERVLEAGRFSIFEATADAKNAALFTQLCRDPELEILKDEHGFSYPWTGVRRKAKP